MPWPKTGATHVKLELPNKGRTMKGTDCLQWLGSTAFEPDKTRSGPRLLPTVLRGMIRIPCPWSV